MAANGNSLRSTDGQQQFSGGVNSDAVPIREPGALRPNQLCWLNNASVRGGGIQPRAGYRRLLEMPITDLWGEAILYKPLNGFPYIVCMIAGRVYRVRVDSDNSVEDLSAASGLTMPSNPLPYMVQGEEFVIIQAGDYSTLPLFFDGNTMRRSVGSVPFALGTVAVAAVTPAVGATVLLTLNAPFTGQYGDTILINGATFVVQTAGDFITLQTFIPAHPGSTVPAGAIVQEGSAYFTPLPGGATTVIDQPFTVPVNAGTVTVPVRSPWTGPVPSTFVLVAGSLGVTAAEWGLTSVGLPPAGVNQIYVTNVTGTPGAAIAINDALATIPELPAAGPMDYYMGRVWEANGREYVAGDIVGGPYGTAAYGLRDSILKFQENTFLSLGGTFTVPDMAGNITALKHPIQLDTSLGEGQLFAFTDNRVYSVNVTPKRADWKTLSEPIQRVAQIGYGAVSDRSVVGVNGDLFFQSIDPGVRSMTEAIRYFQQWGNLPISIEESRATLLTDRALLKYGSGILFDNRVLQTTLPQQTDIGVIHKGLMPLNFDTISTLAEKQPPAWEGLFEGFDVLRVLVGNFGGLERAFAFIRSDLGKIELWEMSLADQEDFNASGDARVSWVVETPSYNWGSSFDLKELDTLELWIDRLSGTVDFTVQMRPDQHPCWEWYFSWKECAPKNNCEDIGAVSPCYPTQQYRQQYIATAILPRPPTFCENSQARPINIGYGFQFRIFIKGYCRIRGIRVHGFTRNKLPYEKIVCGDRDPANSPVEMLTIEDTRTRATI